MRKNFNTTIDEETIALIDKLAVGRSKGQVVDEAVAMLAAPLARGPDEPTVNRWFRETWTRLEEILEMLQSDGLASVTRNAGTYQDVGTSGRGVDPAQIPGVSRGPSHISVGFPCRCVHSGCKGSKFQGASKFANLCPACGESGHAGDPRSCQSCFDDMGPT